MNTPQDKRPEGAQRAASNKQLHEQLDQATARIEALIHIGGMVAGGDSLPDPICELLDEDGDTLSRVFPDMPEDIKDALDNRFDRCFAFPDWAHHEGKLGFVVKIATPVMRNVDEGGGGTYSWSSYYTCWFYGDTFEEAIQQSLEWVSKRRTDELKKQRG